MINFEMFESLPTEGDPVKLKITSVISQHPVSADFTDMGGADLYEDEYTDGEEMTDVPEDIEDAAIRLLDSYEGRDGVQKLEQVTVGTYSEQNGRVTVTYDDSEVLDLPDTLTQITFRCDEPQNVAIIRTGGLRSMFVLEEGCRHTSEYKVGPLTFPLGFYARRVRNTVSGGVGEIELDYTVEMNGMDAQRTRMKIELSV